MGLFGPTPDKILRTAAAVAPALHWSIDVDWRYGAKVHTLMGDGDARLTDEEALVFAESTWKAIAGQLDLNPEYGRHGLLVLYISFGGVVSCPTVETDISGVGKVVRSSAPAAPPASVAWLTDASSNLIAHLEEVGIEYELAEFDDMLLLDASTSSDTVVSVTLLAKAKRADFVGCVRSAAADAEALREFAALIAQALPEYEVDVFPESRRGPELLVVGPAGTVQDVRCASQLLDPFLYHKSLALKVRSVLPQFLSGELRHEDVGLLFAE